MGERFPVSKSPWGGKSCAGDQANRECTQRKRGREKFAKNHTIYLETRNRSLVRGPENRGSDKTRIHRCHLLNQNVGKKIQRGGVPNSSRLRGHDKKGGNMGEKMTGSNSILVTTSVTDPGALWVIIFGKVIRVESANVRIEGKMGKLLPGHIPQGEQEKRAGRKGVNGL